MQTLRFAIEKFGFAGIIAAGLAAAGLGLAGPANAAPSGLGTAQETISLLEAQGYKVVVHKIGNALIEETTVVKIRSGQTYSRANGSWPGNNRPLATNFLSKTIYVDVK